MPEPTPEHLKVPVKEIINLVQEKGVVQVESLPQSLKRSMIECEEAVEKVVSQYPTDIGYDRDNGVLYQLHSRTQQPINSEKFEAKKPLVLSFEFQLPTSDDRHFDDDSEYDKSNFFLWKCPHCSWHEQFFVREPMTSAARIVWAHLSAHQ